MTRRQERSMRDNYYDDVTPAAIAFGEAFLRLIREVGCYKSGIRIAIALAEIENRPIDISTIARLTGIPRSTTKRWLSELEEQGSVTIAEGESSRTVVYNVPGDPACARVREIILESVQQIVRRKN